MAEWLYMSFTDSTMIHVLWRPLAPFPISELKITKISLLVSLYKTQRCDLYIKFRFFQSLLRIQWCQIGWLCEGDKWATNGRRAHTMVTLNVSMFQILQSNDGHFKAFSLAPDVSWSHPFVATIANFRRHYRYVDPIVVAVSGYK